MTSATTQDTPAEQASSAGPRWLVEGGCCAPVLGEALDEGQAVDLAAAFKVLADPIRLRLFSLVANADGGEACVCDLVEAVDRAQGTVSHHLGLLVEGGLLSREKRGRWSWYAVVPGRLAVLRDALAPIA